MKSTGQKEKRVMSEQEKVKDNTGLSYFSKYAIISARTAILQDSTSENGVSANK